MAKKHTDNKIVIKPEHETAIVYHRLGTIILSEATEEQIQMLYEDELWKYLFE